MSHNETKNNRDKKHIILILKTKFTANLMQQNGIAPYEGSEVDNRDTQATILWWTE